MYCAIGSPIELGRKAFRDSARPTELTRAREEGGAKSVSDAI